MAFFTITNEKSFDQKRITYALESVKNKLNRKRKFAKIVEIALEMEEGLLERYGIQRFSQRVSKYFPKYSKWLARSLLFAICYIDYNYEAEEEEDDMLIGLDSISPLKRTPSAFFSKKSNLKLKRRITQDTGIKAAKKKKLKKVYFSTKPTF